MTKEEELLKLIGGYHDGLSVRDIQKKLPLAWFVGPDHNREIHNALQRLKKKGQVKPIDLGNGVNHWVKVGEVVDTRDGEGPSAENGMEALACGTAEGTADVTAGADASAPAMPADDYPLKDEFAGHEEAERAELEQALEAELKHGFPVVAFYEKPVAAHRFAAAQLPEGIELVSAYRVKGDNLLCDDLEDAVARRDRLAMNRLISAFLDDPASDLPPNSNSWRALITAWEDFKMGVVRA